MISNKKSITKTYTQKGSIKYIKHNFNMIDYHDNIRQLNVNIVHCHDFTPQNY